MVRPETDSLGAPSTVIGLTGIARPPASVAVRVSCPAGCFSDTAMVSATVLFGPTGQVSVPSAQETVTVSSSAETVTLPGSMPSAASVADSTTDCGVPLAASVVVGSAARPVMPAVTVSGTVCGRRSVTLTVAGPSFAAGAASNENITSTWAPALIGGSVQFATTTAAGTATANAAACAGPVHLPPWMIVPVRVKPSGSVTSIDSPPVEVEPPVLRTTALKEPEPPAVTVAPSGTSSSRAAGVAMVNAVTSSERPPASVAVNGRVPAGVPAGTVMPTSKVFPVQVMFAPSPLQPSAPVSVTPPVVVRVTGPGFGTVPTTVTVRVLGEPSAIRSSVGVTSTRWMPALTVVFSGSVG